jgi:hypothetical protein
MALALAGAPDERLLGGHDFGQPVAVEPVFVSSFVSFRQGVGLLTLRGYRVVGIPEPLSLRLLGLTEVLRGQGKVHDRVGIGAFASGTLLSGADKDSALFLGARGAYELRLTTTVRLLRTERVQLSGRVGLRRAYELRVTPADVAVRLLDDTEEALSLVLRGAWGDSLLSATQGTYATSGLSGAWALSDTTGVMASFSTRVGRVRVVGDDEGAGTGLQLGGGLAVDVRPTEDGVLGLQLGVQDNVDRTLGLEDAVAGRHRVVVPLQVYGDLGTFQLGVVPSVTLSWGSSVREQQLGIEGRAVGYF